MNDKELENKWNEFSDIPVDQDDCIETDWWLFEKGTPKNWIWEYFDEHHSRGTHYLIYDYQKDKQS